MNDEDRKKQKALLESLEGTFPGIEIEFQEEPSPGLSSYYIRPDLKTQWIIKVTDECLMNNRLSQIIEAIRTEGIQIMMDNPNEQVVLYQDFSFKVGKND